MGQSNCCAGKGKVDQVDMERARQKEINRQKERERRMSEKKKRESAKQGARIREGNVKKQKAYAFSISSISFSFARVGFGANCALLNNLVW